MGEEPNSKTETAKKRKHGKAKADHLFVAKRLKDSTTDNCDIQAERSKSGEVQSESLDDIAKQEDCVGDDDINSEELNSKTTTMSNKLKTNQGRMKRQKTYQDINADTSTRQHSKAGKAQH